MKNIKIIILLLLVHFQLNAQQVHTGLEINYDPCTGACSSTNTSYGATEDLNNPDNYISDFGPRDLTSIGRAAYDWHQGVDISPAAGDTDRGYYLRSIVGGSVLDIRGGAGLKYIVIDGTDHDFGYVHIFRAGDAPIKYGDCSFVKITDPDDLEAIEYGILYDTTLISDCTTCYYVNNQDTIWAENTVQANQIIGVIGDSGTGDAHLHLNRYERTGEDVDYLNGDADALDPLQYITHTGPTYDVAIYERDKGTGVDDFEEGIEIKYSASGTTATEVLVRPTMRDTSQDATGAAPYNSVLNISTVELKMRNVLLNDTFNLIEGPWYRSEIRMGATDTEHEAYPLRVGLTGNANDRYGRFRIGNTPSKTGIYPLAYRDNGENHHFYTSSGPRRWDDFYFTDFLTRIHQNDPMDGDTTPTQIAHCPQDARYNDDRYYIYAEVTDVRDSTFQSDTLEFVLDNFKPFIQNLTISHIADVLGELITETPLFDIGWVCLNSNGEQTLTDVDQNIDFPFYPEEYDYFAFTARSSEPLDTLTLSLIPDSPPVIQDLDLELIAVSADSMEWQFQIAATNLLVEDYTLNFTLKSRYNNYGSSSDISTNLERLVFNAFAILYKVKMVTLDRPASIRDIFDFSKSHIEASIC